MAVGLGCSNMNGCIFDKWCWRAGKGSCTLPKIDSLYNYRLTSNQTEMDPPDFVLFVVELTLSKKKGAYPLPHADSYLEYLADATLAV